MSEHWYTIEMHFFAFDTKDDAVRVRELLDDFIAEKQPGFLSDYGWSSKIIKETDD